MYGFLFIKIFDIAINVTFAIPACPVIKKLKTLPTNDHTCQLFLTFDGVLRIRLK